MSRKLRNIRTLKKLHTGEPIAIVEIERNITKDIYVRKVMRLLDMAAEFLLTIQIVFLLVSACFASPHLPLSGKSPRLPRSTHGW